MIFKSAIINSLKSSDQRLPEQIVAEEAKTCLQLSVDKVDIKKEIKRRDNQVCVLDPNTGAHQFTDDGALHFCDNAWIGGEWRL